MTQNLPVVTSQDIDKSVQKLAFANQINPKLIDLLMYRYDLEIVQIETAVDVAKEVEGRFPIVARLISEHGEAEIVKGIYHIYGETSMPLKDISDLVSKFGFNSPDEYVSMIREAVEISGYRYSGSAMKRLVHLAEDEGICYLEHLLEEFKNITQGVCEEEDA